MERGMTMGDIIRQPDIYDLNLYKPLIKDTETLIGLYEKLGTVLEEDAATLLKQIDALDTKTAAGIQKLNKIEEQSSKIVKAKNKTNKGSLKLKKQLDAATDEEVKGKLRLQKINKTQRDILKDQLVLEDREAGTLEKLNAKNRILARERAKVNTETKKGATDVKRINAEIDRNNKLIIKNSDSLKKDRLQIGGYRKALDGVRGVLGQIGLAFGAFSLAKDVFSIGVEFEKSIASLSAITGLAGDDLDGLKLKVLDVATSTKKGASEVAQAFELIGSAKPELLADADALALVTEKAIILNQAIGGELEASALALTGTLNQFSLGAEEAGRVINVLAAGSQAGAAPVDKINESLEKFGVIAASSGVSVEESVGAIEVLAEKAIVGADAGTKLRNVLTTLSVVDALPEKAQQQLAKYGVNTDIVSDTTLSLSERLQELGKISENQTALFQVFGKENLVAGKILLENTGALDNYTQAVTGTNVAVEQAATNQDTWAAIIEQLKAAWETLIAKFTDGSSTLDFLKGILKFIANNLELVITVIARAVVIFGTYRVALKAAALANRLFSKTVIENGKEVTKNLIKNQKAFAGIGVAIVALVFVVKSLIEAYGNAFSVADQLAETQKEINTQVDEGKAKLQVYGKQLFATNVGSKERLKLINQINAEYGTTLENLEDEAEFVQQVAEAYKVLVQQLTNKIEAQVIEQKLVEATTALFDINRQIEEAGGASNIGGAFDVVGNLLLEQQKGVQDLVDAYTSDLVRIQETSIKVGNTTSESMRGLAEGLNPITESSEDAAEGVGKLGKALKELSETEILDQRFKDLVETNKFNLRIIESELIRSGATQDEINKAILDRRMKNLEIEKAFALKNYGEFSKEFIDANIKLNDEINSINKEQKQTQAEQNQQLFKDIESQNDENLKIIENNLIKEGVKREDIDKQLSEARIENLKKENEAALELFGENSKEYLDANLALNKALAAQDAILAEARKKQLKELEKSIREAFGTLGELLEQTFKNSIEQIDKQIEKLDDEVEASKDREQSLKEDAKERGLNADESIQAERNRQKAALDEQQKLQRKKEEIETFLAILKIVVAKIEGGDGNPLANVKSQVQGLKSFASGLSGFYDGTNTTLGDAMGYSYIPGDKDTHIIKAHKDEMILGVNNSRKVKGMTQNEVVEGALMMKNGLLYKASMMGDMYSSTASSGVNPYDPNLSRKLDETNQLLKILPSKFPTFDSFYEATADMMIFREKRENRTKIVRIKGRGK